MGQRLVKYLEYVSKEAGAMGKARVVMKTGITESKAASEPDSDENINKMKMAIKDVVGKDAPSF